MILPGGSRGEPRGCAQQHEDNQTARAIPAGDRALDDSTGDEEVVVPSQADDTIEDMRRI